MSKLTKIDRASAPDEQQTDSEDSAARAQLAADVTRLIIAEIPVLKRVAARICRNDPELAQDLVQDTLMRALKSQHQWQLGSNMKAWLLTILRTQAISHHRKASRRVTVPFDEIEEQMGTRATQGVRLEFMAVARAWGTLSPDYRRCLNMVAVEGLKYQDAADAMGLPLGTVRSRISRARAALNVAMDKATA
jgi:RNA polymerase sigma-70 factor (ECF subfamily)